MKRFLILLLTGVFISLSFVTSIQAEENYLIPENALFYYSKNYLLMDMDDGRVLYERNGYEKVHPASITKVATLITALEMMETKNIKPSSTFTFDQSVFSGMATNASIAGFLLGETVTVEDLLYGIIMPSGADATRAVSLLLTGTVEGLSEHMNAMALKLGLKDTNFVNTSGLDDPKHLSTPYDLAKILQYAMQNEAFVTYYTRLEYTTSPTRQHPEGISFVNRSLKYGQQLTGELFTGAKSGHTDLAERALSSVSMHSGMNLIFISTNAPQEEIQNTNITDAVQTYRYMKSNYLKTTLLENASNVLTLPVKYAKEDIIINIDSPISQYIPSNYDLDTLKVVHTAVQETFEAPIQKGTPLAKTQVFIEDKVVYEINHVAEKDYEVSLIFKILNVIESILKIIFFLAIILFVLGFAIRSYNIYMAKKRRKKRQALKRKP